MDPASHLRPETNDQSSYITGCNAGSLHTPWPSQFTAATQYQQALPGIAPLPVHFSFEGALGWVENGWKPEEPLRGV